MFKQITKDNWLLYAQKHYDNPTFETEKEFWDIADSWRNKNLWHMQGNDWVKKFPVN